jgi:hypothetical protein
MSNADDDLKKKYPLLFRESRHAGEGGVICTSCDCRVQEADIVKEAKFLVLKEIEMDIYFCRGCSDSVKNQLVGGQNSDLSEEEREQMRAEQKKKNATIIACSFCNKDQFDRKNIFAVLRYYQIDKAFGHFEIHPVTRDHMFLSIHGAKNPKKIAEVFICGSCARH